MVFHWRLSDSESPHVSRTLLSILAVLNNAVVLIVSTRHPTSKSFISFNYRLVTVPKEHIPIGICVTFLYHSFFLISLQGRCTYRSFHIQFYSMVSRDSKVVNFAKSLFLLLLITIQGGLLAESRGSVCMWTSHTSFCVSFSRTTAGLSIYHLCVWTTLNFLHISLSFLVLYSFCALICCIRLSCDWWFPYYCKYYYYYYYSLEFFTAELADGLSLEIEWQ